MNQEHECPICGSSRVTAFLDRKEVPVHQNLLMNDRQSALKINRGRLSLACCEACGFVFNLAYQSSRLHYSQEYDNTQTCSPLFDDYLSDLAEYLVVERGIQEARIVEVGCGKGHFLRRLIEFNGARNVGLGFDPSYVGPEIDLNGRLTFIKSFYGAECSSIPADVVVCRHVIEHVPDPLALLKAVKEALRNSPRAKVFFETPCVEWILRNRVIWDFFYEHCSYFTADSLATAFEISGFYVERVQRAFGGQYLWLEAGISAKERGASRNPGCIPQLSQEFARSEIMIRERFEKEISDLSARGGLALWGAGAKGVTLANLIDPKCALIKCIIDLNPKKQGKYVPGTGHPIISYKDLPDFGVENIVLMNPNYRQEIVGLMREFGLDMKIVDLMA
jgi:SAM-dependent methyltransferase